MPVCAPHPGLAKNSSGRHTISMMISRCFPYLFGSIHSSAKGRSFPCWSVAGFLLASTFANGAAAERRPSEAAQLYLQAFEIAGELPRDRDEFVRTATRESVARIEEAMDLANRAAEADAADWGIDWEEREDALDFRLPGKVRNLARLGTTYHTQKLDRGDTSRFARDMAGLLAMGRQFSEGSPLIHYLTAGATEGIVRATVKQYARTLPPEVLDEVLQRWQRVPPGPDLVEIFATEQEFLRGSLWNVFAGTAEFLPESAPRDRDKEGGLEERLRVSSIVAIGDEVRVGFEDVRSEESFSLRPGESREDLELVSVDTASGRAVVRQGEETAIIALAPRRIAPVDAEAGWERIEYWADESGLDGQAWLDGLLEDSGGDKLQAFHRLLEIMESDAQRIRTLLTEPYRNLPAPSDPDRFFGLVDPDEFLEEVSPFNRPLVGTMMRTRQIQFSQKISDELLVAGIHYLRNPGTAMPVSEVTGEPLSIRHDGDTLIVQSTLTDFRAHRRGQPLYLEFPLQPAR